MHSEIDVKALLKTAVMQLLLGGVAGLTTVSAATAADLPVKAKAVEYVKVCSAYGAGYFYIPGTDTCLKLGGFVRFDTYVNAVGTFSPAINSVAAAAFNGPGAATLGYPFRDADDPQYLTRTRAVFETDARTNTDYGTLRSYLRFGSNWDSEQSPGSTAGANLFFDRAFIQFAGFTFGYTSSMFDPYKDFMMTIPMATSMAKTTLLAYTAEFGNGFSASLSLEDAANRATGVQMSGSTAQPVNNVSSTTTGLSYTNFMAGQDAPDIIANLRVEQAWGSAQVSGALHQVGVMDPLYVSGLTGVDSSSTWGYALGAFLEVNLPVLAKGDSIFFQANYAKGGAYYLGLSSSDQVRAVSVGRINLSQLPNGALAANGAFYTVADAVATSAYGDYELTSGWAVQGQFRHFWTPSVRSALLVDYVAYEVPQNTVAAYNFNMWQLGVNTIWSPVKNLDIGAELLYTKLDGSVPLGNYSSVSNTANGAAQASLVGGSTDVWSGGVRVQRNF